MVDRARFLDEDSRQIRCGLKFLSLRPVHPLPISLGGGAIMKIVVIGEATSINSSPRPMYHLAVRRWRKLMVRLFEPYHPERHYMRGPGPKSRKPHVLSERALWIGPPLRHGIFG
jgi:hypothetical protein